MRNLKKASSGRKRALLAVGSVVAVASLVTAAAFTDFANLNLGNGTDGSGIGSNNTFDIKVVNTDSAGNPIVGEWQDANTPEGVNINVPGADLITPGDTVSVEIPFQNASPKLTAAITFSLQDRPGLTSSQLMLDNLLYTVTLDGTDLVTDVLQADVADIDLGEYLAGEGGVLKLTIELPDQGTPEANNAFQKQVSYAQAHFDATSVQP